MTQNSPIDRRTVLEATGGALAGLGTTGLVGATPESTVEVNVGFAAERGRTAALDAASEVVREFDSLDVLTIRLPKQATRALADRADVRYVEENGQMEALAQTLPWGIDRVDADVAHANGETGDGADVAIIDGGIDADHPDLQANLGKGKAFVACDSVCSGCGFCDVAWDDDGGHGTHVAGVVGAVDNVRDVVGVAPETTLHAVKVLGCDGFGSFSDVAAGIEYTADQGWDVANLSFGGDSGSQALKDAVQYATNNGVLLVGAAGNDGPCTDCVDYPAAYPEVVAVSATNSSDGLSYFSSTGPEIELAAPGTDIYSTTCGDGYDTTSGTSMACPHVAGGGAQLMADGYSNSGARSQLKSTAESIGLASNESGAGLLDVAAALGLGSFDN